MVCPIYIILFAKLTFFFMQKGKPNNDGDVVVAFVLREKDQDEKMIALLFAILKLGITFMALSPTSLATDFNWSINVVSPVLLIHGDSLSAQAEEAIRGIKALGKVEMISLQDLWDAAKDNIALDSSVLNLSLRDSELWSEVGSTEKTVGIFLTSGTVSSPHAVRIGAR
jgi:acyl-CoA synthetase (AMP-forming)/AMP-acid ligase II